MYRSTGFTREEISLMLSGKEITVEDFDGVEHRYNLYIPETAGATGEE